MNRTKICEFCDGELKYLRTMARFSYRGETIYIDAVPSWVCTKCGEQYFDAPVYKHLEDIARHRTRIKKRISFPLAEYNMAFSK